MKMGQERGSITVTEHPLIELYITLDDEQQNRAIEQMLSSINLDEVVLRTLHMAGITQQVMLTLLVSDEDGIREMNKQYRQQNKATDVLSFPLLETPLVHAPADQLWAIQEGANISAIPQQDQKQQIPAFVTPPAMILNLGDIMISWPTIVRQANVAGHDPLYELFYLLSHGVLHLIGYDDVTETGYQAMVHIQETVLKTIQQKA